MMKKLCALFLALTLAAMLVPALAESGADPLSLTDVTAWAQGYLARALQTGAPLNDPSDPQALSEDGYAFIYSFATLYLDSPVLSGQSVLQAVVVTDPDEAGPRGVSVDHLASDVLDAYYNENEDLVGDASFAALYLSGDMPAGAMWAWVQRDGQRIMTIQYAVHQQLQTGGEGYTDCGLIYTIQDNLVAAIRAYGLNARISADEVLDNLNAVEEIVNETAYAQVKTSLNGADLETFGRDDLVFSGLDFLSLSPEEAEQKLGACREDDWMQDDTGEFLRAMEFASCSLTYVYDANKQNPVLSVMTIDSDALEGPRAVRIGDTFASVLSRFRSGEGVFDGQREVLYGDGENAPFGLAEYGTDASATLWYTLKDDAGRTVTLYMSFTQMFLSEIDLFMEN